MKSLIISIVLCTLTIVNAMAQTICGSGDNKATITTDEATKTLTVTGKGDLQKIESVYSYYFGSNCTHNIFSDDKGTEATEVYQTYPCTKNYYVKVNYTKQDISPKTVSQDIVNSKDYYVKNGVSYISAYKTSYKEGSGVEYATAEATEITDFTDLTNDNYIFDGTVTFYKWDGNGTLAVNGIPVSKGEAVNSEAKYYFELSNTNWYSNGSGLCNTWTNGVTLGKVFKTPEGKYTLTNGIYTALNSTAYDQNEEYYTVTFTDGVTIPSDAIGTKKVVDLSNESRTLFVFDGKEYVQVQNGDDYKDENSYYIAGGESYAERTPEELFNIGYTTRTTKPFIDYLVCAVDEGKYETVVFDTEGEGYATIDYTITQHLMHCKTITTLDLGKVQIDHLDSYDQKDASNSDISIGTFIDYTKHYSNPVDAQITKLILPHIKSGFEVNNKKHYHIPTGICACLQSTLNEIVISDNATCIEEKAFDLIHLTNITLDEDLLMVGGMAFGYMNVKELVIPSKVEYIGSGAFGQGYVHDVYFLGKKAPIVEMDAFGSKAYVNNDAIIKPTWDDKYLADRSHYINNEYMAAMMHLRTDLSDEERAAYTDITRDFHVFGHTFKKEGEEDIVIVSSDYDKEYPYSAEDPGRRAIYCNGVVGDESTKISSKGGFTIDANNCIESGRSNETNTWVENSGFYDKTVGTQYRWPSRALYCRSYAVATNGLLWNGIDKISSKLGTSYKARSYDINCDGDTNDDDVTPNDYINQKENNWENGSEYIGLHQFVLVTYDVNGKTTPKSWDFENIKGANWYTICIPINMSAKEVRSVFGDKTQVCEFTSVERNSNNQVKLYFTTETCLGKDDTDPAIVANMPYMIRPSKYLNSDEHFVLPDYVLQDPQIPTKVVKEVTDPSNGKTYTYTFEGQYNSDTKTGKSLRLPQYCYFLGAQPGNTSIHRLFMQTGTTGSWKPFTCAIIASEGESDYNTFFNNPSNFSKQISVFGNGNDFVCDINGDNIVDSKDINAVAETICGASSENSDVNHDGVVDIKDINALINNIYNNK